jgi:hypothetical protein
MMAESPDAVRQHVAELRIALEARAAGYWWVVGDRLEQLAFSASSALPADVSNGFAQATQSIALTQADLGVVRAALTGAVAVSRASELPADSGSGYWLRAFGASRSVAVPLHDLQGRVRAVFSVALADSPLDDETVAARIATTTRGWGLPFP